MDASLVQGSLTVYAGFAWGFDEYAGIKKDYEGASTSGAVGLTLNIPYVPDPFLSFGLGVGIGNFRASAPSQVQGWTGYVSGGIQMAILPTGLSFGIATSVVDTWYTIEEDPVKLYGNPEEADLSTLYLDINNGYGVPFFNAVLGYIPVVPALVRTPAAEIATYVVAQHYATFQ